MLPSALAPSTTLRLTHNSRVYELPLCRATFLPFPDTHGLDTFGGKDMLKVDGKAQFAEVAILRAFEADGWLGRWMEPYGRSRMNPALLRAWNGGPFKTQEHLPIADGWVNERLHRIAVANRQSYSGCWDVVAWKGERLVFAESKKRKKDRIRGTQLRWLEAALSCACAMEDFLVVEWSLT